jgi:hypothetical protein
VFLSYNSADRNYVRKLAAALSLAGARLWFDEWNVRPGDSVPSAVEQGLTDFDISVLAWSDAASRSHWVRVEMEGALARWLKGEACRLVPIRLDDTAIRPLLAGVRYIDGSDGNHVRVVREILGIESDVAFRLAVQEFIDSAGLDFREFYGVGVLVTCPKCGATPDYLEGWQDWDHQRGDQYAGARCKKCGWSDGGEV